MERAGIVTNLQRQIKFLLEINNQKICTYIADFEYDIERENGIIDHVIEDAKGIQTPEFKLKKKMMKAIHNIDIHLSFKKKW